MIIKYLGYVRVSGHVAGVHVVACSCCRMLDQALLAIFSRPRRCPWDPELQVKLQHPIEDCQMPAIDSEPLQPILCCPGLASESAYAGILSNCSYVQVDFGKGRLGHRLLMAFLSDASDGS